MKAVKNGTEQGLVVIGQPSTLLGTTVVSNGTSPKASLSFDIDGEQYGWVVGDIVRTTLSKSLIRGLTVA